jgi:arylsulfatase A
VFSPPDIGGLPLDEVTIAEVLQSAGYRSAIVGKWHLGVGENNMYLPTNQGFDYYMGIPYSHDFCPCFTCFYPSIACYDTCRLEDTPCPLFENTTIIQQPADLLTITQTYINASTSFIHTTAAKDVPFFLYMAFQHTHHPQFAGKKFTNTSTRLKFGDALNELDWGVGQIFSALSEAGVSDNTFVFFTSDNGPSLYREVRGGNAGPLRCGKGTTWEGGVRMPAIAWWPSKISPGRTQEMAATVDLLPTFAAVAGATPPSGVVLDGIDMAPILFRNQPSSRDSYIYFSSGVTRELGVSAVRWKQYKAHYNSKGELCPDTYPDVVCRGNFSRHYYDPPLLYDLNADPGELYELDPTLYHDIISQIDKLKTAFESTLVWGESQMGRGTNPSLEPCANSTCAPSDDAWPTCCRTNSLRLDVSRAIH